MQVIHLSAPVGKPDRVDPSKAGTEDCDWCCDNSHKDMGRVLTHSACNNTGHKAGCQYRIRHLRR